MGEFINGVRMQMTRCPGSLCEGSTKVEQEFPVLADQLIGPIKRAASAFQRPLTPSSCPSLDLRVAEASKTFSAAGAINWPCLGMVILPRREASGGREANTIH